MNTIGAATIVSEQDTGGLAGHPRGLTTLFSTELWERFSYYGMRAILVLYMTAAVAGFFVTNNSWTLVKLYGGIAVGLLVAAAVLTLLLPTIKRMTGQETT